MTFHLYNTPAGKVVPFTPQDPNKVTLYTCGPTVYNYPHIGNWFSYIYWDTLVRTLLAAGYAVERTMNITDVGHLVSDADDGEDKLEKGARREGKSAWDVATFYTNDFIVGMGTLNMIAPTHLIKATDMIDAQLEIVRTLKEKGYTYQTTDGIYFDTANFPRYANFAHLNLEAQKAGARVDTNDEKRQPWDFALWKFSPIDQKRDMQWPTPSNLLELPIEEGQPVMGFPGWHLECSAIAMETLGKTIDLHTGGIDHIPVHHTNEIAQSEAATEVTFARYWMHNNHLKSDGTKLAKSLGNTYTLQDLKARGYDPLDLRMLALQSHYRSEGNFTFESLDAAKNRLSKWRDIAALRHQTHDRLSDDDEKNDSDLYKSLLATSGAIREALYQDLATPHALSIIDEAFDTISNLPLDHIHRHGLITLLETIDDLLGISLLTSTPDIGEDSKKLLIERQRARENKDWVRSDELRDLLAQDGIVVKDTSSGPVWAYGTSA